jgi:tetratricopeptide (TPR) repeat protein
MRGIGWGQVRVAVVLCALAAIGWPAQAHEDKWVQVTSPHFTISSNAGEKEARRIAAQCEDIREVFHDDFPNLLVDGGIPTFVIAVKNEDSLKALLPDFWNEKNRVHPGGVFQAGADEDWIALRTDLPVREGINPYIGLYEDYVFSILRLNYSALPAWLRVGVAVYYGNTLVDGNSTVVGSPTRAEVMTLQRSQLIPLADLMAADARSPLMNDREKMPLFYAESWALVHYFTLDPDVQKQDYLSKYLKAYKQTSDGVEAARETFGDLNALQSTIDRYARQLAFYSQRRPAIAQQSADYKARELSPAEALTIQADFLQHTNHTAQASEMLRQAAALQPDLPAIHECTGFGDFVQHDNEGAHTELEKAFASNPQDYRALFFLARVVYRESGYSPQSTARMRQDLETVVQINPNFAPAWAFLSVVYRQSPATQQKSLDAAVKARQLMPASVSYAINEGEALLALNRVAEARALGKAIDVMAVTPQERSMAEMYDRRIATLAGNAK